MPLPLLRTHVQATGAIAKPFAGFVFLCGGPIPEGDKLESARQFALERVKENGEELHGRRVIVAEKATDLLQGTDFTNLLDFENYLAALASCIVIFVESPGSIAELGCFSVMKHVSPKLLIIFEQRFADGAPSFITRGPIELLRKARDGSVQAFPYSDHSQSPPQVHRPYLEECWDDIAAAIGETVRNPVNDAVLDGNALPHRLLLISDIVDLLIASRLGEIMSAIEYFGVQISQGDLAKSLRLLQKFEFIATRTYGRETFYISIDKTTRISYRSTQPGRIFDRQRFQFLILKKYKVEDERKEKMLRALAREKKQP